MTPSYRDDRSEQGTPTRIETAFASAALTALERREEQFVSWGFYDLSFSQADFGRILDEELDPDHATTWQRLASGGHTTDSLLSELLEAGLVYELHGMPGRYRTRFAEGVRLLARLRQVFRGDQWATAPNLVSDVKVRVAPRQYPKRDQSASSCWADLAKHAREARLQGRAFDALAHDSLGRDIAFAGFQRRAFARIFAHYGRQGISGTVISAGTGSGKTKAFYVPAFLGAVADIARDPAPSTKIIAVYPRNVLLADQLREALSEAAKLRQVLDAAGLRSLTFGALLSDTPPDAQSFTAFRSGQQSYVERFTDWTRRQNGWAIPYLRSPMDGESELTWRDADRAAGRTALFRSGGAVATPDVPDGVLRLTREAIQTSPPDVLFLSAEMLNQQLGNPAWGRALGVSADTPGPRLLLLDEVHTYEGIPGAQVAWVLRRWRHWAPQKDLHVVGLSATLREAPEHLGRVIGIDPTQVVEYRPTESELVSVDAEYSLAIKGDPASAASLLSTTIQAGMLLTRLLTPRGQASPTGPSLNGHRFFASKLFGFTDKLDVVNRWYSDMRHAEVALGLAKHRLPPSGTANPDADREERRRREIDGQVWGLPIALGHDLRRSLNVSRCSSQDPGANASSDLIVATSSLEVGFDDPEVGATIHHKAPRSLASFVQRKGRAGRRRGTRPWTVVVLSDYGADRWAFQNADQLFEPQLDSIYLPVENSHVMRMQAAYFLIDWIGRQLGDGDPYRYLRRHGQPQRGRVIHLLTDLLNQGTSWRSFRHEFRALFRRPLGPRQLSLSDARIDTLLWDDPRPLLRHAIPSLLRKLDADWQQAGPNGDTGQREDADAGRPLPLFIPRATFGLLETGEARLTFTSPPLQPSARSRHTPRLKAPETLPTVRALLESAPGNASKRYSTGDRERAYWLEFSSRLGDLGSPASAPVSSLYPDKLAVAHVDGTTVYQPHTVPLAAVPKGIRDTSRASWFWRAHFKLHGDGQTVPVLLGAPWDQAIASCRAFLHRNGTWIDVTRYASECRYEIRPDRGDSLVGRLAFRSATHPDRTEAVGTRRSVDGLLIHLRGAHLRELPGLDDALRARLRTEYFRHCLRESRDLPDAISSFLRDWLWQTSMSMLTATAARQDISLAAAHSALHGRRVEAAERVLDVIFRVRAEDGEDSPEDEARLRVRVLDVWRDPTLVPVIEAAEHSLWQPPPAEFDAWVRQRYAATIAQAIRAAAVSDIPGINEDDLALDVVESDDGGFDIFVTETTGGGVGIVEMIVAALRRSPDAFHEGIQHHLSWCPREAVTEALRAAARGSQRAGEAPDRLRSAFEAVRLARSHQEVSVARDSLRGALRDVGVVPSRRHVVAIISRLLQPGTSPQTDALTAALDEERTRLTETLHAEIEPRAFSYHALRVPRLREPLERALSAIGGDSPTARQLYAICQRMVLFGCEDSCPECLDQPTGLSNLAPPSRALARRWLRLDPPSVEVSADSSWADHSRECLRRYGHVRVVVPDSLRSSAVSALHGLLTDEVDVGYLLLPMSVTRIERQAESWAVHLTLKDAPNA